MGFDSGRLKELAHGFIKQENKKLAEEKKAEYKVASSAVEGKKAAYAASLKIRKANQAYLDKANALADQGLHGELADFMVKSTGGTDKNVEALATARLKRWQEGDNPDQVRRDIANTFKLSPMEKDYDIQAYAAQQRSAADRRAYGNWLPSKLLGIAPHPSQLKRAVNNVEDVQSAVKKRQVEEEAASPADTISLDMFRKDKKTRAGYYKNRTTQEEVQGTKDEYGNIYVAGKDGKPMPLTDEWKPVSLTEGVGQGAPRAGRVVSPQEIVTLGKDINRVLSDSEYTLKDSAQKELREEASQFVKDMSVRGVDVTDSKKIIKDLLMETKEEKGTIYGTNTFGAFEDPELGPNAFNIEAFRTRLDAYRKGESVPIPVEPSIPVYTIEEARLAPSGTKFRTTDGRTMVKR